MAVELATGIVRLQPSARGFRNAVSREIGPDLRKAGEDAGTDSAKSFSTRFATGTRNAGKAAAIALGGAFAGAAVFGKSAVDAASNLAETQSKVNTVFGDSAGAVNEFAKKAATALGQSEQEALNAAGTFGNMFVQLGIGTDKAADMSLQMTTLASDFASFHNADITEVIEAQTAAFRGEYDSLQKFVPTINAAAVEQKAIALGYGETTAEIDAQEKALATQILMMEGAGDAAGDFARTSDGLANQQRIASANFKDLQATLGQALIPVMTKLTEVAINVVNAIKDNWPQIKATVMDVVQGVQNAWETYGAPTLAIIQETWQRVSGVVIGVFNSIKAVVVNGFQVIQGIIKTVMAVLRGDWGKAWDSIKQIFVDVWEGIKGYLDGAIRVLKTIISNAVDGLQLVWAKVDGIWHFFRDNVIAPITGAATTFKDTIARIIGQAVSGVTTAWNGIRAIVDFFRDSVYDPVMRRVNQLKDAIGGAFEKAVSAVKTAWDTLQTVVKTPINFVIGFYNNGIRKVWNAVISKIPGIGDLGEIARLNKGGWVPGHGNGDTVPAMLTPGEFVVTKKAAQKWGPGVLAALNRPSGTIDPAIFGYAEGGYVRSVDEAMDWARKQAGKPYKFPLAGPDAYDCSGLTSALINFILGRNPYSRRHSSGSIGSDPAVARGDGNGSGLLLGARPPYMTNSTGQRVGHIAATLQNLAGGLNVEATPPRVRVGPSARGARSGTFTELYHLPGYSGFPSAVVQSITDQLKSLLGMGVTGQSPPLGDLLQKMVNQLPRKVFEFLVKKLPELMWNAVKTGLAGTDSKGWIPPGYANGGMVRRNGPMLVGERGPELLWGRRGQYVEANDDVFGRQLNRHSLPPITINNYHRPVGPSDIARGIQFSRVGARTPRVGRYAAA